MTKILSTLIIISLLSTLVTAACNERSDNMCYYAQNLGNSDDSSNPSRERYWDCNLDGSGQPIPNGCPCRCGNCVQSDNGKTIRCFCISNNPFTNIHIGDVTAQVPVVPTIETCWDKFNTNGIQVCPVKDCFYGVGIVQKCNSAFNIEIGPLSTCCQWIDVPCLPTPSGSMTTSASSTPTLPGTPFPTRSQTGTVTPSPSTDSSPSTTPTVTETGTPSGTVTQTTTASPTSNPSLSPTRSLTRTPTPTNTQTPSVTPSVTPEVPSASSPMVVIGGSGQDINIKVGINPTKSNSAFWPFLVCGAIGFIITGCSLVIFLMARKKASDNSRRRPSICVQGINLNNADDSWNPPRVTYTDCNESNLCESRCGDCERDENKGTMTCYCSKDNPYPGILSYRVEPWYLGDEGDTCPIRPCHKALEYVSEFFGTGAYEQYGSGYTRCCEYFKTYECAT